MGKKTFSIISLGCFRNNYDSEIAAKRFWVRGYEFKSNFENCDLLIINTCGFIDQAKKESIDIINQAISLKKEKKIKELLVFGCLVKRYGRQLKKAYPQVDRWLGVEEFKDKFAPRKKILPAHLDFLKICEGCLHRCSYCAIPLIKGGLKSRSESQIIKEVKQLDSLSLKELNIIGQDITSWGKDLNTNSDLPKLVKSILENSKNVNWVRLIYTHPKYFSNSLIDLIASEPRICKYIDLPIQHISDRILKLMNRQVSAKSIIELINRIRKRIPDCVIRTSIIVGFPGETKKEFSQLLKFIKDIKFERLGAFSYSREEGTAACKLKGQVSYQAKQHRLKELMNLQKEITSQSNSRFLGRNLEVLVEEKQDNIFLGRTQYDAYDVDGLVLLNKPDLKIGSLVRAKIIDIYDYDMLAA